MKVQEYLRDLLDLLLLENYEIELQEDENSVQLLVNVSEEDSGAARLAAGVFDFFEGRVRFGESHVLEDALPEEVVLLHCIIYGVERNSLYFFV